jgi:hypothetical protein
MTVEEFVCGAPADGQPQPGSTRWGHSRPWRLPVKLAKWVAFFNELVRASRDCCRGLVLAGTTKKIQRSC